MQDKHTPKKIQPNSRHYRLRDNQINKADYVSVRTFNRAQLFGRVHNHGLNGNSNSTKYTQNPTTNGEKCGNHTHLLTYTHTDFLSLAPRAHTKRQQNVCFCAYLSVNIDRPLINFQRNTYQFKWAPIMKKVFGLCCIFVVLFFFFFVYKSIRRRLFGILIMRARWLPVQILYTI